MKYNGCPKNVPNVEAVDSLLSEILIFPVFLDLCDSFGTLLVFVHGFMNNSLIINCCKLFSKVVFLKPVILKNFCDTISTNMPLSSTFWQSFDRASGIFFNTWYTTINLKVLMSFIANIYFIVCDASLH